VTKEIRIYAEGGGDGKDTKSSFRLGLDGFLKGLKERAREKKIRWQVVACGGRGATYKAFRNAINSHPAAFNLLLVDSEEPVDKTPWLHLRERDNWDSQGLGEEHCQLMVQMMEAWLVVDAEALERCYGQGFRRSALPRHDDVEQVEKRSLERSLENATKETSKGTYHKTRHAPKILKIIDTNLVRNEAKHCDRLFETIEGLL